MHIEDYCCHCDRCKNRTEETYQLSVTCLNCGEKHIGTFRKGDRPGIMRECPFCGVSRLRFGTTAEARRMDEGVYDAQDHSLQRA